MAKLKTKVVTGFIPVRHHTRSMSEYEKLGYNLSDAVGEHRITCCYRTIRECWLTSFLEKLPPMQPPLRWSQGINPAANSLEFHVVQYEKFKILEQAAQQDVETDTFIWMDYGITRLPGMDAENIRKFLRSIRKGDFAVPGKGDANPDPSPDFPCRRFLGPLLVVPREHIPRLTQVVQAMARLHIKLMKMVTWEVNILAIAEGHLRPANLRIYQAEADATMLTRY